MFEKMWYNLPKFEIFLQLVLVLVLLSKYSLKHFVSYMKKFKCIFLNLVVAAVSSAIAVPLWVFEFWFLAIPVVLLGLGISAHIGKSYPVKTRKEQKELNAAEMSFVFGFLFFVLIWLNLLIEVSTKSLSLATF